MTAKNTYFRIYSQSFTAVENGEITRKSVVHGCNGTHHVAKVETIDYYEGAGHIVKSQAESFEQEGLCDGTCGTTILGTFGTKIANAKVA